MKNRHSAQIVAIYQIMINRLKACGINSKHRVLNNECFEEFKEAIKVNKTTYQVVPADITDKTLLNKQSKQQRAT